MRILLKKLLFYINPFAHLGETNYYFIFPLLTSVIVYILGDIIGAQIWKNSVHMGNQMVFITFTLAIYFSFRAGIKGGLTVTCVSIIYFLYFIYSRGADVPTSEKITATITVGILTVFYLLITFTVGWLRQKLDKLIKREINARIDAEGAKTHAENERKRLQAILEQLPVGVVVAKKTNGKITHTNKELAKILELEPLRRVILKESWINKAYLKGKKMASTDWPLSKALLEGKTIIDEEIEITTKTGNRKILFINAAPVYDKNGEIISGVSTLHDVTTLKFLERQKDNLITAASHELKTPLTSIVALEQILAKKFASTKDKESSELLQTMDVQLQNLTKLINALLDVNKLERGKLPLHKEKFILEELIRETVELLQRVKKNKIAVEVKEKAVVFADKERIRQVLTNMLTNAIKYSPQNSDIIVRITDQDKIVVVSVQDFGIGIPKEAKQRIFNRFFRAKTERIYPGMGLGLYISAEIIKQHDQKIWLESEEQKGSTFYFSLPKTL